MNRSLNIEDFALVRLCLEEEDAHDAFEELVRRYKNLVYSIVLRMVTSHDDANDLAQEVFIKAYRNLEKYSPEFKFSTWITRIATNHVIDHRRRKRLETVFIEDMADGGVMPIAVASIAEMPEQSFIQNETMGELMSSIASLPEIYRVPLLLFYQKGFSYQEIAKTLGEPISKVKNRLFRGRRMLRDIFEKTQIGGRL